MKIVIIGTGGVGGYFGGKLAEAGEDVTFVARGEHFKKINSSGLKVKSWKGDFEIKPAKVVQNISELKNPDLILLGIKSWQVSGVAEEIKNILSEKTIVQPMQNGVLAAEELKQVLPEQNVINGLCWIFSKIENPGIINHMSSEPVITFGECNNEKTERVQKLEQLYLNAGIKTILADDIDVALWKKFILICLSGLCAVANSAHGPLRELPETREMMINLLEEVYQVGKASGVNLQENVVEKTMKAVDNMDYNATSSLTRDVWEGKPSEIEYQNGTVVKLGKKLGIPVPVNTFVYNCLLPQEIKARNV